MFLLGLRFARVLKPPLACTQSVMSRDEETSINIPVCPTDSEGCCYPFPYHDLLREDDPLYCRQLLTTRV